MVGIVVYPLLLDCGHTVKRVWHDVGDSCWCGRCGRARLVLVANRSEWVMKCTQCRAASRHGQSESLARTSSVRHKLRTGHVSDVKYARLTCSR